MINESVCIQSQAGLLFRFSQDYNIILQKTFEEIWVNCRILSKIHVFLPIRETQAYCDT